LDGVEAQHCHKRRACNNPHFWAFAEKEPGNAERVNTSEVERAKSCLIKDAIGCRATPSIPFDEKSLWGHFLMYGFARMTAFGNPRQAPE
jgi:hypothetical protein